MSKDSGVLYDNTWSGSMNFSGCGVSTDWEMAAGCIAEDQSGGVEYDKIQQFDSNIWRWVMHFKDRPESLQDPRCSTPPAPSSFRFDMKINDGEDASELYMNLPEPDDGDDSSGNDELDLGLDIISSVSGPYKQVGFAVVDYFMDGGNATSVEPENNGGRYTFDIGVGGNYDDLPYEPDDARVADVSLRVNNDYADGIHTIEWIPEYTFYYYEGSISDCCADAYLFTKTTTPGYYYAASYEAI